MKTVASFMPRILPYLPGCSQPMASQALVDYAISFCEDSLVLRQTQEPIAVVANVSAYSLDAPADQQVARVIHVWLDGKLIQPLPSDVPIPGDGLVRRPTAYYTTRVDSELLVNLYPIPDADYTLTVETALRPTRDATTLQDDLFTLWVEPLVLGTLSTVMTIPDQPFSNPAAAMTYSARALQLSRKARIEGGIGRVRSSQRVAPRPFA